MRTRRLGKDGPEVSALGLGCMGMSEFYGPADRQECLATLGRAADLGVTLLDTADVYGMGANEALLSEFLRSRRSRVFLATKFGNVRGPDGAFLGVNGRPDYVRRACDASLLRLRVDEIDLYYQHRVDPDVPIEETVGAMARLVDAGKVRFLGLSEAAAGTLRRAAAVHPLAALQSEYSLWTRDVEPEILPACRELGIALVAYSPLGRGFLTGTLDELDALAPDDYRRRSPRFLDENRRANRAIAERVRAAAESKGCTPAQLALAWLLARGEDVIPIPGTKRRRWLEENVAAAEISLTPAEVEALAEAIPPDAAKGARYVEPQMRRVNL